MTKEGKAEFTKDTAMMCVSQNIPLSFSYSEHFRRWMAKHSRYGDVKFSRRVLSRSVNDGASELRRRRQVTMQDRSHYVTLNVDGLSSSRRASKMCGAYTNSRGILMRHSLNGLPNDHSHGAEAIKKYMKVMTDEANEKKFKVAGIVTDNAAPMQKARIEHTQDYNADIPEPDKIVHIGCTCHTTNLCTSDVLGAMGKEATFKAYKSQMNVWRSRFASQLKAAKLTISNAFDGRWESHYDLTRNGLRIREVLLKTSYQDMDKVVGFSDRDFYEYFTQDAYMWLTIVDFSEILSCICVALHSLQGAFCPIDKVNHVVRNLINNIKALIPQSQNMIRNRGNSFASTAVDMITKRFFGDKSTCKDLLYLGQLLDVSYPLTRDDLLSPVFDDKHLKVYAMNAYACDSFSYNEVASLCQFLISFRNLRLNHVIPIPKPPKDAHISIALSFWEAPTVEDLMVSIDPHLKLIGTQFAIKLFKFHTTTVPIERMFSKVTSTITTKNAHMLEKTLDDRVDLRLYDSSVVRDVEESHMFPVDNIAQAATLRTLKRSTKRKKRIQPIVRENVVVEEDENVIEMIPVETIDDLFSAYERKRMCYEADEKGNIEEREFDELVDDMDGYDDDDDEYICSDASDIE